MTDADRLRTLLRSALTPTAPDGPSQDLWPRVRAGLEASPRSSRIDVVLVVAATIALFFVPRAWLLLIYHF